MCIRRTRLCVSRRRTRDGLCISFPVRGGIEISEKGPSKTSNPVQALPRKPVSSYPCLDFPPTLTAPQMPAFSDPDRQNNLAVCQKT